MFHVDRMMWGHAATEVEKKDVKEKLEKSLKKAEKKAEKLNGEAKKSKGGKDAAAAKESAKDAKKLRNIQKTVETSAKRLGSTVLRTNGVRRETGYANPSRTGNAMIPKNGRKLSQKAKVNDTKVILSNIALSLRE